MKSELTLAFNEITERFGLSSDTVMEAIEAAMVSAYRRAVNASSQQMVEAKIDLETGKVTIFTEKEVVEEVESDLTETTLEVARAHDPEAEIGDLVMVESTPSNFGRVAAQTAKQVILQRLREAERDAQYDEFIEREGDMVHGTVHSITPQAVTVGLGRAEAILPRKQQIPGERFHVRDRIRVYVLEVRKSSRGPVIVVSRTHPNMLRRLLEMEVPEINQGLVEIKGIAREAGKRAKVAVAAMREGVDPVGACVGLRGVRIQSIVRDLNDEKIDVIEWNPESEAFIAKALSPARVSGVFLDDDPERGHTAMVVVPEDQLSLAIGRAGVNARLSARLTGWRIDIKSLPEAASESLHRLQTNPDYADLAKKEAEELPQIEAIIAKKGEGRPVMPEEYKALTAFTDRVQREVHGRREEERQARLAKLEEVKELVKSNSYQIPLAEIGLPTRVLNLLSEAGYETAGDAWQQLELDEDSILGLPGIGPKAIQEMRNAFDAIPEPEPEIVEEPELEELEGVEGEEATAEAEEAESVEELDTEEEVEAAVEPLVEDEALAADVLAVVEAEEGVPVEAASTAEVEDELEAPSADGVAADEVEEAEAVPPVAWEAVEAEPIEEEEELLPELDQQEKKTKKKTRVIEFDPELGEMVVKRRRKRGGGDDWGDFEV